MVEKKTPPEPTNLITDKCEVIIRGIRRTVLKIDWLHLKKRNEEFRASKKKKIKEIRLFYSLKLDNRVMNKNLKKVKKFRVKFLT